MASYLLAKIDNCLSCGICHGRLSSPKVLSCQHTFCKPCLENWAASSDLHGAGNELGLPCPSCRHTTDMPYGGVPELKNNYLVNQLNDVMASHGAMKEEELSRLFCDVCEAGKQDASSRCYECDNFLCEVCKAAHLSFKVLRHHTIVDLRELPRTSGKVAEAAAPPANNPAPLALHGDGCEKHPGEVLRFFCETCQNVVCRDCTVVDHPKPDHTCVDLKDAIGDKREELLKLVQRSREVEAKLDTALNELTEMGRRIESVELTVQAEANRAADHALVVSQKRIEQKRQRHLQDIVSLGLKRKKIVSGRRDLLESPLACFRQTQSLAARIVESGSDQEVLASYRALAGSLHQQLLSFNSDCLEIGSDLAKFEFSSQGHDPNHQNNLHIRYDTGSLGHIRGEWVLQREIGCTVQSGELRNPSALAVSRWGELIVVENQRVTAQVFEQGGSHRLSLTTIESIMKETRAGIDKILGFVRAVAFSRAGHIIICDCSNFVKVFSQHGRYLCAFTTTAANDSYRGPVCLCCLAVDERNRIYVGDRSRRCVTVHEPNGSRIRQLECTRPAQLAIGSQYLIVLPADPTDSIKLLDHVGKTQRALRVPDTLHPWLPVSVACSSESKKIFVVNGHKDGEKAVHEFTMEGDYRGCISRNLAQPAGIALSRSQDGEELFVADDKSVKVFRKI